MKILMVLNYYFPYISGLSECGRLLAEELAKEHEVTVLTSRHDKSLSELEMINGVKVVRANVSLRISKGYISGSFIKRFIMMQKEADIVNLHLPMIEAGLFSYLTTGKKLVLTYQCDINLTDSLINRLIINAMDKSSVAAFKRASKIIVSSLDYAQNSRVLPSHEAKWVEIHPASPVYRGIKTKDTKQYFDHQVVGFCGRIVEEKGIHILLQAAPLVKDVFPNVTFLIAGDYKSVAGGSVYEFLKESIGWDDSYVKFLGKLSDEELRGFYQSLDVFVLPSINSLEAFGMVQVEAMLAGVPVVASNLPGVRGIVKKTGMGEIVAPNRVDSLADGIIKVLRDSKSYYRSREEIERKLGVERAIEKYVNLFNEI